MVGQALKRGRYRYYRCRRSYAGYSEGKCDSRYVRGDVLENVVIEQIADVLSHPDRILDEACRLAQKGFDSTRMEAIGQELKQVEERQRRLARLYLAGAVPESILNPESKDLTVKAPPLLPKRTLKT